MKQTQYATFSRAVALLGLIGLGALLGACATSGYTPNGPSTTTTPVSTPAAVVASKAPSSTSNSASTAPSAAKSGNAATSLPSPSSDPLKLAKSAAGKDALATQAQAETDTKISEGQSPPQLSPPQLSPSDEKDLWDRIRRGFSMPELDSPIVAEKERSYLSQPAYLQRMMTRGGRYLYFIVEELERRKMPTELALLPFVESAMNPVALSSAKAAGLWQFIPSTGRAYDLNQNWWVDNRRDVVKSTHAALDYLQKIYTMHGNDWFLALASYNWGEGSVGRAVKSAKSRGLAGDYASLTMPNETRHYVPKLLALKHIIQRSNELNIALPPMPNRPYFVTIEKTRPIDLKLAAKFAGMTVDEFVGLNPAHNRPVIAASKNNEIKLPADRVTGFLEAVKKHSDDNLVMASWQPYTVKPGETLAQVAHRGGVPESEVRKANGLKAESRILPGTKLLVPHAEVADESKVESFVAPRIYEQVTVPAKYHTVGRKESLGAIAGRYGLSVASLKAWNGIKKTAARGMNLLVRPAYAQTVLTAESGERQVVSSGRPNPVAAKAEAVEAVAEEKQAKAKPPTAKASKGLTKAQQLAQVKAGARTSVGKRGKVLAANVKVKGKARTSEKSAARAGAKSKTTKVAKASGKKAKKA